MSSRRSEQVRDKRDLLLHVTIVDRENLPLSDHHEPLVAVRRSSKPERGAIRPASSG